MYLETRLAPLLVGEDPRLVERLWERMYRADRGIRRLGVAAYALSALDIALWDLVGKVAGQPLYRLWGGVTDRIAAYGSGGWPAYRVEDMVEEAQRYAAAGPPLLQAQGPPPRSAGEPAPRRGGPERARRRCPPHGRRQPEARRAGEPAPRRRARGPGPRLVRGAGARGRHRRVRRGRPRDPDPGGDRREPLHALRVPRALRAARRAVPHARRLPGEWLQRDAQDRAPGGGPPAPRLAPRRPRALGPRRRGRSRTASSSSTWTGCRPISSWTCRAPIPRTASSGSPTGRATAWRSRRAPSRSTASAERSRERGESRSRATGPSAGTIRPQARRRRADSPGWPSSRRSATGASRPLP